MLRTVFKRCLVCEKGVAPSCNPLTCGTGEICIQLSRTCDTCASVKCMPEGVDPTAPRTASKGPNVGAIAGGVIGGIAFVAIATFIVWKYCLKGRRRKYDEGDWQEVDMTTQEKPTSDFASRRSTRHSTHTVASMASSVLTRASNIIQIAYIPGVTNRSGPGSPDLLVPPVPPIPAMSPTSGFNTPYSASEQHFFLPDFARDSMASGTTNDGRSSYARTSIAPSLARGSVASTMYRQNAIVSPLPAQTIVRGKAAVVSVRTGGTNSPADTPGQETPPVPEIDPKHTVQPIRIQMPSSSSSPQSSIRSTATLGPVRALNIVKKKPSMENTSALSSEVLVPAPRPLTDVSLSSTDDGYGHARARRAGDAESDSESEDEDEDDDHSRAHRSLLRNSDTTDIADTPTSDSGPFSDSFISEPSRPEAPRRHTSTSSALRPPMTPIAEGEESKRLSGASKRTRSPFEDVHRSDL